jgi:alanine racemase
VTAADEFVLIGRQGDDEIRASDVARSRTTNSWEVVTTMSARLSRVYHAPAGLAGIPPLVSSEDR